MTKSEMHYLNCTDDNCELFACLARRDYQRTISVLGEQVQELIRILNARDLRDAIPNVAKALDQQSYDESYAAHSADSCDDNDDSPIELPPSNNMRCSYCGATFPSTWAWAVHKPDCQEPQIKQQKLPQTP